MTRVRALWLAIACAGVLLALGDVALASECHQNCDGGYLAVAALVGGGLALGSSALGAKFGASADAGPRAARARVDDVAARPDEPPLPQAGAGDPAVAVGDTVPTTTAAPSASGAPGAAHDAHDATGAVAAATRDAPGGIDAQQVAKAGTDYGAKLAKELAPRGDALESGFGIAGKVLSNEDRIAGLAEGLTDAAEDHIKDVVKDAAKGATPAEAIPSPAVGTTPKYCPSCGTKTREHARFCAHCGRRLG